MRFLSDIVLRLLGLLLLAAAALKGWQLLTEPAASNHTWLHRAFVIFSVEFEIGMGIWLLSGLFRKAGWAAGLTCFSLFSFITLYKGLIGFESCGCFGEVRVNPWLTLFAVDIPAVIALAVFRPKGERLLVKPRVFRFVTVLGIGLVAIGVTSSVLIFNEPAKVTSSYESLEPQDWVGRELPILQYIDICPKLKKGNWLILFYHFDCPDCIDAVRMYEQQAEYLSDCREYLQVAFIEVPPYGGAVAAENSPCLSGKLKDSKEWFVTTPTVVMLESGKVRDVWEGKAPDLDAVLENVAMFLTRFEEIYENVRKGGDAVRYTIKG